MTAMLTHLSASRRRSLQLVDFCKMRTTLPDNVIAWNGTYTRNSAKTVVHDGALVTLSANQFGTSYDDVTGLYGYVPEPAATNLATYSDGNASTYSVSNVSDGTAVPGFTNGLAFGDNSVQRYAYRKCALSAGTAYSVSVFVIMDDGGAPVPSVNTTSGDFRLVVDGFGVAQPALVQKIGGSLYRVSSYYNVTVGGASKDCGVIKYTGQSARTFRVTGIQVETGLRATSYIATTGSTASRAADVLSIPIANLPGFNAAGYTLFADFRSDVSGAATRGVAEINDMTIGNRAYIAVQSNDLTQCTVVSGGVGQAGIVGGNVGKARGKAAISCSANSFLQATNSVAPAPDMSGSMPVSPLTLNIGTLYTGSLPFNGFIFSVGLIPQVLTQAQINGLTTL